MKDYAQLEHYLRTTRNFGDVQGGIYDFAGIVHLMLACLDNLHSHAFETELEDIAECMTAEQMQFFLRLAKYVESSQP